MEKNTKNDSCYCDGKYCCGNHGFFHRNPFWRIAKILFLALIILLVFKIGIGVGMYSSGFRATFGNNGMMITKGFSTSSMPGANMMYSFGKAGVFAGQRIAGTIASIDGNEITLNDNSGEQQIVYTSASTVIMSDNVEIPLSDLKAKQFVIVMVSDDMTAQSIEVK
ncbi:MAG: hypothetical protein G01um101477_396 [Candidatus Doudnabacteria bacterium Gr01-1014_77]|uniref:DUF5666 domain-containing protein n=1 Tax=Candidatus Doudnabacteria bacterium Gr01-1014_77 TaxID=2017133 RepID=A0A554JBF5_9BACT|nr:MAG: hypothetical protein G01um101477_396 [Candidatus Doudnabacteria bacterium Gr01-1014_77]